MTVTFCLLLILINGFLACGQTINKNNIVPKKIDYNLSLPDRVYSLPATLYEISGITTVDATTIACVQDEHGIVFLHDLENNKTIRNIVFSGEGDYEDIARVDNTLYVLRSDEMIAEITNFRSEKFKRVAFSVGIPGKDAEGLCYDIKHHRLLITPKQISEDHPENKGKRFIYGFDLISKKMVKGPVLKLDIQTIESFAIQNNIKIPMKGKKDEKERPDIKLQISALGIHPITNRLFVLSGPEQILFVFDMTGKIEYLERLNKDLFPQPEGITFMKNGDMLISNEGRGKLATLVRFNYKPKSAPEP
jgi:uncharacterized protein YjiK